ncbi:MAG: choice-of-anchor E domain-containing protein [Nostocaceae cyanobacterium]|nr:choice-of-anchor E domain-containing protein [Nostocaceae cyanobacterium]
MKNKFVNFVAAATTLAGIVTTTAVANAATLTKNDATTFSPTDIIDLPLSIEKFNPSVGTLQSVMIEFTGDIQGSAGFENQGPSETDITVTLGGDLSLHLDSLSLLALNPQQISPFNNVPGTDGVLDFGGTSGQTIPGLTATASDMVTLTDNLSLQSFTGTGNVDFLFSAIANSVVSGSGNVASFISTDAKASVKVTYEYEEPSQPVPEPSTILGFGVIAGLSLVSGSKKIRIKMSSK